MHRLIATNVATKAKRTRKKSECHRESNAQCNFMRKSYVRVSLKSDWFGWAVKWLVRYAWIAMPVCNVHFAFWQRTTKCSKLCSNACTGSVWTELSMQLCVNIVWCEPKYDSDSYSKHRMEYVCTKFISFYSSLNGTRCQLVSYSATEAHCHAHSVWLSVSLFLSHFFSVLGASSHFISSTSLLKFYCDHKWPS